MESPNYYSGFPTVLLWVIWNLFLALIPVGLAYYIERKFRKSRNSSMPFLWPLYVPFFLVWLAFLPNTCYLLTEWRHFFYSVDRQDLYVRAQYDRTLLVPLIKHAFFFACFSGAGIITFVMAIRPIERILKSLKWPTALWATPFYILMSLGVYLGLVLRFNSWDLVSNPSSIISALFNIANRPVLIISIILFGLVLWAIYAGLSTIVDAVMLRFRYIPISPTRLEVSEYPSP